MHTQQFQFIALSLLGVVNVFFKNNGTLVPTYIWDNSHMAPQCRIHSLR